MKSVIQNLKLAFSSKARKAFAERAVSREFRRVQEVVKAQYEAGQRWSSRRSYVHGWVRDARFDADSATRREILRKSRYFERNNAIVNRLADLFEQYSVGPMGLRFVPASSDPEWNQAAKTWWAGWEKYPDISSLQTFGTIQSLSARTWLIDGEVFIWKTRGRERENGQSFPRIQLIESHRVDTPPRLYGDEKIIDGIQVDARGRPEVYWVQVGLNDDDYTPVPAANMIHIYEPSRVGMYRGLPMLYPVLNDLHDLDDLQLLEMDAAKDAAATTEVIKTKTGEMTADDFRRYRFNVAGTQGTSGGSSQERTQYYEDVFKGRAKVMRHGDEYQQYKSERPSVATRDYWDYLTSKVCAGVGISKLLVFPWSMQGTVIRADLDVASAFFRSRSAVLAAKFTDVWLYVMDWATRNVPEIADRPLDWQKVSVRPPRSVNVDVGRNAAALISEYESGWRTLEGICGELGEDWVDVLRQRAVERQRAREFEDEYGLERGELIKAALEAIKESAPTETSQQSNLEAQTA